MTFITTQDGPTSTGLGWRLRVLNVSVTPYTFREPFFEQESILSQDNLKVGFELSVTWRIRRSQVRDFVERFTTLGLGADPEKIIRVAYDNYIKQAIRTFARAEVQKYDGLQIKNNIDTIDTAIAARMNSMLASTPFEIIAALVSDIRYPEVVATAVAQKIAATAGPGPKDDRDSDHREGGGEAGEGSRRGLPRHGHDQESAHAGIFAIRSDQGPTRHGRQPESYGDVYPGGADGSPARGHHRYVQGAAKRQVKAL